MSRVKDCKPFLSRFRSSFIMVVSNDTSAIHEYAGPTRAAREYCRRSAIEFSIPAALLSCSAFARVRVRHAPFTPFKCSILSLSPLSAVLFAPESSRISRLARVIASGAGRRLRLTFS